MRRARNKTIFYYFVRWLLLNFTLTLNAVITRTNAANSWTYIIHVDEYKHSSSNSFPSLITISLERFHIIYVLHIVQYYVLCNTHFSTSGISFLFFTHHAYTPSLWADRKTQISRDCSKPVPHFSFFSEKKRLLRNLKPLLRTIWVEMDGYTTFLCIKNTHIFGVLPRIEWKTKHTHTSYRIYIPLFTL